jgi:DNA-binding GntR family transcriptional regulator
MQSRRLLTDDVFERLRDDIIRGRLVPGERLRDQELAATLGLSRATVRTALLRLKHVGLVEAVPNLYTRVSPLDLRRYLETEDTASALYLFAVRFGTYLLTDEHIARLRVWESQLGSTRTDAKRVDSEAIITGAVFEGFFRVFLDALDNGPLERTLDRLRPHLQRVLGMYAHLLPTEIVDPAFRDAVEAASRHDVEGASDAIRRFFDEGLRVFHDRLRELPEFSSPGGPSGIV